MPVTWTGADGPYTRGGVASCLTWGPEIKKDITITRPNEHWYQRSNTLPPSNVNHVTRGVVSGITGGASGVSGTIPIDNKEIEREKVHEAIAGKIAGEIRRQDRRSERNFERNVIAAVHSNGEPLHSGYQHIPQPPSGNRSRGVEGRHGYRGAGRKVLIAEEGAPITTRNHHCCGAACSKCCSTCPEEKLNKSFSYDDTTRSLINHNSLVHYNSPTRSSVHHTSPTRPLEYHNSPSRSLESHYSPTRSYPTLEDYEPVPVSTYTAEYGNKTADEFRMSRKDFMKHRELLAEVRNAAAEERKELMMIYQSVKADEKFHGASPQKWNTISPKLSEIESETRRQREELDHYNRVRQMKLEKRERIQEKYERAKANLNHRSSSAKDLRMASLERSRYGSRCTSPDLNNYRNTTCSSPTCDYRTTPYQIRMKSCCSSPTCTSSCTTSRCSSPACYDSGRSRYPRDVTYRSCNSPSWDQQWKPNVVRSQINHCNTWDSKPPIPAMTRSRTIYNDKWNPRLYDVEGRLTRSHSFSSDGGRFRQTGWQTMREPNSTRYHLKEPDSTSHRQLTLYNPGRLTPVGSYTMHNERDFRNYNASRGDYDVGRAYSRLGEESDDTKVKVDVDCQPNSDTLVSFRVQSRQV